jgi:methionyl aminopeptidase|tara:strand:+ start:259 stop:1032 length:774 start_codon:yes stop_codon:yes gene_type:complete
MIPIKTESELTQMRAAGKIAANVLAKLKKLVEPGVNTYDLDQEGKRLIEAYGATSACYNYPNGALRFPAYTCLSVNDEIVHGIGDIKRVLQEGDIIALDVSIVYDGWIGDNAFTVPVGEVSSAVQKLLDESKRALDLAIDEARPGNRVGFISNRVQSHILPLGLGIVRDFVGHGVGRTMHEAPQIPNFGPRKRGETLRPGMTLAIEPMITMGNGKIRMGTDGWTALSADASPAAHFEHTVLVTKNDPEILTTPDPEI